VATTWSIHHSTMRPTRPLDNPEANPSEGEKRKERKSWWQLTFWRGENRFRGGPPSEGSERVLIIITGYVGPKGMQKARLSYLKRTC
jgi:hypothetical protein